LRELFTEEWDKKSIKKAPKTIKEELGELANLSKEQLIFTRPANNETPAIAVIWWPWGHGATYSMRIKLLATNYDDAALQQAQVSSFKKLLQRLTPG